ncbi:MAG: ABC transporter ATP-binding protein [bacterium]|nr:MAG: ABC transporter ATP-binding protein [bacterium]
MSENIIEVNKISKKYVMNQGAHYDTLRDKISSVFSFNKSRESKARKIFWALKDVSFNVKKGEVLGLIGRNGAGKSTLLKILSRITPPTSGSALIKGRVGSLLEVGTGFHQELSGRENIYLNGSILGMKQYEIKKKFDEIVDFSGVEKFLDTPVKYYSSGMTTRLAFSVAAFLEPEILLVDEVLSVGDAEFQKKSLGKMEDITKNEGRTILFVSHNLSAIEGLCSKCILLDGGKITTHGDTDKVIDKYMSRSNDLQNDDNIVAANRQGSQEYQFTRFWLENSRGNKIESIRSGQDVNFVFEIRQRGKKKLTDFKISFSILDNFEHSLILHRTDYKKFDIKLMTKKNIFKCSINSFPLSEGRYKIGLYLENKNGVVDNPGVVKNFQVNSGDFFNNASKIVVNHSPFLIDSKWSNY